MKKGLRPEMIIRGIEDTLKVGISPGLNFIFGNKGDNKETMKKMVDFLIKYDDFAQKRTIRPVTPYPGSPLYYDAIEMDLLDKENPAEDFYERKHLNSDLICCNFTKLSDEEFYECLHWANAALMKNYYDRQRNSTLAQIDHLYKEKDVTFRGFRHSTGSGQVGEKFTKKSKVVSINGNNLDEKRNIEQKAIYMQGNEIMDGMVNWENSSSDGERFSQQANYKTERKTQKSFETYLKRKTIRAEARKEALKAKRLGKAQKSKEIQA